MSRNHDHQKNHGAGVAKLERTLPAVPSEEEIRVLAYRRFCERDGQPGDAMTDWLEAEHELRGEHGRNGLRNP